MDDSPYLLLLNDRLKKEFLSLSNKEKERLFEKLSFLANGMWDAGVKVKKLKGPSNKVVFEGRLSKGDRIIFTLGKEGNRTCIYLWETVHHDDISRETRKISPQNAPFLDFEPASEESFEELLIDKMPEELFTQEPMEQKVEEDYGPQKWLEMSEEQLKRLLGENHPDFFELFLHLTEEQQHVLNLKPPILLSGTAGSGKTTLAVYYLIKGIHSGQNVLFITFSKFLKEYSENLYKGLVVHSPLEKSGKQVRFATFREVMLEILNDTSHPTDLKGEVGLKEFAEIFSKHSLARTYDAELIWEEIRSIIKGAHVPLNLRHFDDLVSRYMNNSLDAWQLRELKESLLALQPFDFSKKFDRIIEHKTSCADFNDFVQKLTFIVQQADASFSYVLGEIQRILHTKAHHIASPLLTLQEYLNLGKKRAPNFLYDREEIYTIAQYYQAQLEAENRFDEIDLCRKAIMALEQQNDRFQWDLVVCDEVQDFSDIQLSFLFRLAKVPGNIVCAGDPKQIINPSGFRWEELKDRFYEHGMPVPDVSHLHLNFRCVGSIVRLSNALLKLKQQLVGISGYEQMEDWKFNGRPPFVICGISERKMLMHIGERGAGRVIIVRSEQEKQHLKKTLETELIFTIQEAKGLEFDTVLLWKFSSDEKASGIWRKIVGKQDLETEHYPLIRHEINLLYVAVTRARNTLIIYDGLRPSSVWQMEALAPHLFLTDEEEALRDLWHHVSTREEWKNQGDYFYDRQYYAVALECYRNASDEEMADICSAHLCKIEGRHSEAARLFAMRGKKAEAAQEYEDAKEYEKALSLWEELKEKEHITTCTIFLCEASGRYDEAARLWAKEKRFDRAVENWKLAKAYHKLGDYWFKEKSYKQAAEYYEMDGQKLKAALCYKRLRQTKKAADLYVAGGDYASALPLYKRLKDRNNLIVCYNALNDHYQVALIHEKRKEYEAASKEFIAYVQESKEHAKKLREEADAFALSARMKIKAALRYVALSQHREAADIFFEKGLYQLAADEYLQEKDLAAAAQSLAYLGKPAQAVELYEEIGNSDAYKKAVSVLRFSMQQRQYYNRNLARSYFDEATELFQRKEYSKSLTRFIAVNDADSVFRSALLVRDRDEEVIDYFLETWHADLASKLVAQKKTLSVSEQYVRKLIGREREREIWELRNNDEQLFLLDLITTIHAHNTFPSFIALIHRYLYSFNAIYSAQDLPPSFIDLAIDTRFYNILFQIARQKVLTHPSFVNEFKKRLLTTSESYGDALLKAIALDAKPEEIEAVLSGIPLDIHTYMLYGYVPSRFQEALDFILQRHDIEKAVMLCLKNGRKKVAARVLEEAGQVRRAARDYRDYGYFDDAIRCYKLCGDFMGLARTYEQKGELDTALDLWTKLGKTREIERVKKKMEKVPTKQLSLFTT